jgi:hypothetical protein
MEVDRGRPRQPIPPSLGLYAVPSDKINLSAGVGGPPREGLRSLSGRTAPAGFGRARGRFRLGGSERLRVPFSDTMATKHPIPIPIPKPEDVKRFMQRGFDAQRAIDQIISRAGDCRSVPLCPRCGRELVAATKSAAPIAGCVCDK